MAFSEIQQAQIDLLTERQMDEDRFYVLAVTQKGIKCWSGPYPDYGAACQSTLARDRSTFTFVMEDHRDGV